MILGLLGSMLIGGLIGGTAGAIIGSFLDDESLGNAAREYNSEAFKLLIKEKKKKAVKVGIFDEEDDLLDDLEIQSEKGVSSSIYVGKVIYL
ncbi:MAG: hypothetical protein MJZ02_08630 [Paludibacteraceae bacterium]|nr:hypothetical protein [Paludibacteraceae bacterium]